MATCLFGHSKMTERVSISNLLLASLAPDDFALLKPHLTRVSLTSHAVLQLAERPIEHIHFPLEGMVSLVATLKTGETIEIAAIGREGAIGTKVGLQPQLAFAEAIVQLPGHALRMNIEKFHDAALESLAITHLATCANDIMMANLQQSAACNAIHGLEARLARWLLHARDRNEDDTLPLTQEFLSMMLGVRRTTVSLAAHTLQESGLIRYRRGKVDLLDREGLEQLSCECYGTIRRNIELIIQTAKLAENHREP
jgi:CRP-like cAMP-binding protein